MSYRWNLRQLMAARDMFATTATPGAGKATFALHIIAELQKGGWNVERKEQRGAD